MAIYAIIYAYIWPYTPQNMYCGCLDMYFGLWVSGLVFGCLNLHFGYPNLYLGVWICLLGVWICLLGVCMCMCMYMIAGSAGHYVRVPPKLLAWTSSALAWTSSFYVRVAWVKQQLTCLTCDARVEPPWSVALIMNCWVSVVKVGPRRRSSPVNLRRGYEESCCVCVFIKEWLQHIILTKSWQKHNEQTCSVNCVDECFLLVWYVVVILW